MELRQPHYVLATVAAGILSAFVLGTSGASASPEEGQKLAFSRAKGNCLVCHAIKGGPDPGDIGPPLEDMKARFPDRKELIAIVGDATKRNPLTVMPPFKRNLIINDQEIEHIVDFLYTR
jgi:sulfur-oxidizing protein SoxX